MASRRYPRPDSKRQHYKGVSMNQCDTLLSKLEKVQSKGNGRFVARCPAHADSAPSLSIRVVDDGRVLLHCFAGCSVEEVVSSIGLTLNDLFPPSEKGDDTKRPERRPFSLAQILAAFQVELLIGVQILSAFSRGEAMPEQARARAGQCSERLAQLAGEVSR
jgi:hypothetical protein